MKIKIEVPDEALMVNGIFVYEYTDTEGNAKIGQVRVGVPPTWQVIGLLQSALVKYEAYIKSLYGY